jgi:2-methylfumaryl-CoA hydratase
MSDLIEITAPYFEDFERGQEFCAPAVTLTAGHAATYQALTGDRLRLPLDHHASRDVTGSSEPLAHPLLVANVAIGQSTGPSQRVKVNLFYRGLVFLRPVHLGETLCTKTRVVGLRQNRGRPGGAATGLVALQVSACNQDGKPVLQFWRCPLIPCRDPEAKTARRDSMDAIGAEALGARIRAAVPRGWQIDGIASRWVDRKATDLRAGTRFRVEARDTITAAPELVRLTLNMAMAHTDARCSDLGRPLVYGGHIFSISFAQVTRALPNLLTMLAWEKCEHIAPVAEGDRLRSDLVIVEIAAAPVGALLKLRVQTYAARDPDEQEALVLDWTAWVLSA